MYISIPLAIAIVFTLFKLILPHEERKDLDEDLLTKNKKKYALYEGLAIIPFSIFMGLFIYLIYKTGNVLNEILPADKDYRFLFIADRVSWTMPGIILGFGLVIIPMDYLYRFLLKDEYKLYLEATNRKHGWDGMKIMKPVCRVLIIVGSVSFVLLLDVSVRVTDESIYINHFFSLSEIETSLDSINEIVYYDSKIAPNGNIVDNDQIIFYSNGNEVWSTEIAFLNDEFKRFNPMIQFVMNRNQLEIEDGGTLYH